MWRLFDNIYRPLNFKHDVSMTPLTKTRSTLFDRKTGILFPAIEPNQCNITSLLFRTADAVTNATEHIYNSPMFYTTLGILLDMAEIITCQPVSDLHQKYSATFGFLELELIGLKMPPFNHAKLPYLINPYYLYHSTPSKLYGFLEWRWPFIFGAVEVDTEYEPPWTEINSYEVVSAGPLFKPTSMLANEPYWFAATGCCRIKNDTELNNRPIIRISSNLLDHVIKQELILLNNLNITGKELRTILGDTVVPFEWTELPYKFNTEVIHEISRRHQIAKSD